MRSLITEAMKIRRVRIRALASNFYLEGHVAHIGEEGVVDFSDAETLRVQGKAEIVGEAPARTIPMRDLADPPSGWMAR